MSHPPQLLVDKFPDLKIDQRVVSGVYDDLYRVRDLDEGVWLYGRFFLNTIDLSRLPDIEREFEKSRQFHRENLLGLRKMSVEDNHLAIFWEYRDAVTLEERIQREFGPRKVAELILSALETVTAAREQHIRFEYLTFHDTLIDIQDRPLLMAGTFSHLLTGKGDTTAIVVDYDQRVIKRLGAILLSIGFGKEFNELIEAVQLESDARFLMEQFRDLLNVDPGLMAIIAKCMMPLEDQSYRDLATMEHDLRDYLRGRAITVEGIDFHQLIKSWSMRKQDRAVE